MVDLKKPGPKFVVYHDIKTKDLKARAVLKVMRSTRHVLMGKRRLDSDQSFTDQIFDAIPNINTVSMNFFDVVENVMQVPFMPAVVFTTTFIVIRVFVHCVIGKMHIDVFEIGLKRTFVRDCSKSSKPFFMNKSS